MNGEKQTRTRLTRRHRQELYGWAYILPGLVILAVFCILPIFMTLYYSFTDYNLAQAPEFIAFSNYAKVFTNTQLRKALVNTVIYVIITVPLQTIVSLLAASFLANFLNNRYGKFLRGVIWSFQAFDLVYKLTGGGPGFATTTIAYVIYSYAFQDRRIGYACAIAILLLLVILAIHLVEQQFFKEED